MLKCVVHLSVASFSLLVFACAGGDDDSSSFTAFTTVPNNTSFDGGMDDDDEMEESGEGDGDGDPSTGDGDGDPTTGDGDGDPGDGDGDPSTGDGDGDPGPFCGNGVIDPGETCDGNNFGGVSCMSLGYDQGTLACVACAIDSSNCSNIGGGQPAPGNLYSHCIVPEDCIGQDGCATVTMEGETEPFDGYCTNFCVSDADCAASLGGTAVPQCNNEAMPYCEIDCSGGKTCPQGMECISIQGGKFLCY